jgi:hypothetical protein
MTPMDLRTYQYKVIEGLLVSGHDQVISVALVTSTGTWPTDVFSSIFTSLVKTVRQTTTQKVTDTLMGQFPVILCPLDPSTKARGLHQPPYTCRFLSQCSDQNADFEAALESLVADMVAPVPLNFPAGPDLWGESYTTTPEPKTPGTQVEFEDLTKVFLMLLSASNSGRLHGYVADHLTAK